MNIEKRQAEFKKMKSTIHRKFKGAKIVYTNGVYSIQADNRNVVSDEWSDLQFADTVYDAYKNAFVTEFWSRQYNKNPKKVAACIINMVGEDSNMPQNEPKVDNKSKSKVEADEEIWEEVDYSLDRIEDWE